MAKPVGTADITEYLFTEIQIIRLCGRSEMEGWVV